MNGVGEYLMLQNVSGIKSPYDTRTRFDVDISECASGIMGNFCREGVPHLIGLKNDVEAEGGVFLISDMFRDWMMQWQAWRDYDLGLKAAFSPKPGGSFHNAGRSFDVDLPELLKTMEYAKFWQICKDHGFSSVGKNRHTPNEKATEAWHFDFMGIFEALYKKQRYTMAAQVATMDVIGNNYPEARQEQIKNYRIQAYLLSLGLYNSTVDGIYGDGQHRAYMDYLSGIEKNEHLDMILDSYGMVA